MYTLAVIGGSCSTSVNIPFSKLSVTGVLLSVHHCKFCRLHHKGSPSNPCCKQHQSSRQFLVFGIWPHLVTYESCSGQPCITAFSACLQVKLHGVLPVKSGSFQPLQQCAAYWDDRLKQAAAACNGLTWVSKRSVVGDDLGIKLLPWWRLILW